MKLILKYLEALPKSLYWNIKAFGFGNGLHLPVLVGSNVRLSGMGEYKSLSSLLLEQELFSGEVLILLRGSLSM